MPIAREKLNANEWIVLFYDTCRAQMSAVLIRLFLKNKIAVVVLPAHKSPRLQPLDVSVFGPMETYANTAIEIK